MQTIEIPGDDYDDDDTTIPFLDIFGNYQLFGGLKPSGKNNSHSHWFKSKIKVTCISCALPRPFRIAFFDVSDI